MSVSVLTHTLSGLMVCTNPAWVDLLEYIDNDHQSAHVYLFVSMFPVPFQEEGSLKDLCFFPLLSHCQSVYLNSSLEIRTNVQISSVLQVRLCKQLPLVSGSVLIHVTIGPRAKTKQITKVLRIVMTMQNSATPTSIFKIFHVYASEALLVRPL